MHSMLYVYHTSFKFKLENYYIQLKNHQINFCGEYLDSHKHFYIKN